MDELPNNKPKSKDNNEKIKTKIINEKNPGDDL
jgi:hypothetical protein